MHGDPIGQLAAVRVTAGRGQRLVHLADQIGADPLVAELGEDHGQPQQIRQRAVRAQPAVRPLDLGAVQVEPAHGGGLVRASPRGPGVGDQRDRPGGVPGTQRRRARIGGQPGPAERPQGVQHPVGDRVRVVPLNQRPVHEVGQCPRGSADGGHRGHLDRSGEYGEPDEQLAGGLVQQPVGPLDDVAERPVPGFCGAPATAERVERIVEDVQQPGQPDRRDPSGGQLERQRQPVEPGADPGQQRVVGGGHRVRSERGDPVGEQVHRRTTGQRDDRQDLLTVHPQRLPAGGQHVHPRCAQRDRLDQRGHRVQHVLAVVEHQQLVADREHLDDPGAQAARPGVGQPQRGGHRGLDRVPTGPGQLDDQHPVGVPVDEGRGRVPGQPGLADPAGSAQRQHPPIDQGPADPGQVRVPPDERADRHGRRGPDRRRTQLLAQHLLVQGGQLRGGIDTQLIGQLRPQPGEGPQRLGRATVRDQGPDQHRDRTLAQRIGGHQRGRRRRGRRRPTEPEQRLGPVLQRAGVQPAQLGDLGPDRGVLQLGERPATPQPQGRVQLPQPSVRVRRTSRRTEVGTEPGGVDGVDGHHQPVATRPGRDRGRSGQHPAQAGHVRLQRGHRVDRLVVAPHQLGQRVAVHVQTGVQSERSQQPPLPSAAHGDRGPVGVVQDQRSEHPDHDHRDILRTLPGAR